MSEQWLTIAEAAALMRIHPRTVERRAAAGKLQSRRNDDGQIQILVDVDEPEPVSVPPEPVPSEAFETVREMADRQVDIAAGSASALVRAAQEHAMRAEHQVTLAKQEAGRYRLEMQMAVALVAVMLVFVIVAVGWCTNTITAARAEAQYQRDRATVAVDSAKHVTEELQQTRDRLTTAIAAGENAKGAVIAYENGVKTVIEQTRPKPTLKASTWVERVSQAFIGGD